MSVISLMRQPLKNALSESQTTAALADRLLNCRNSLNALKTPSGDGNKVRQNGFTLHNGRPDEAAVSTQKRRVIR